MYFEIAIGYELLLYIATDPLFFITVLYLLLLIILPGLRYSHSKYFARRKNLCILFMNSSFFATELYINRLYQIIFCALSIRNCEEDNVNNCGRVEKIRFIKFGDSSKSNDIRIYHHQRSFQCRWTLVLEAYKMV